MIYRLLRGILMSWRWMLQLSLIFVVKYCVKYFYDKKQYDKLLEIFSKIENGDKIKFLRCYHTEACYKLNKYTRLKDYYNFSFQDNKGKSLAILFHPHCEKFLLFKLKFTTDVLFLSQRTFTHYFILFADKVSRILIRLIKSKAMSMYI